MITGSLWVLVLRGYEPGEDISIQTRTCSNAIAVQDLLGAHSIGAIPAPSYWITFTRHTG